MHFQEKRLYGYNAVTMATSPIKNQKIWLCFVLPWGGVTPISRPLLENGRSNIIYNNDVLETRCDAISRLFHARFRATSQAM